MGKRGRRGVGGGGGGGAGQEAAIVFKVAATNTFELHGHHPPHTPPSLSSPSSLPLLSPGLPPLIAAPLSFPPLGSSFWEARAARGLAEARPIRRRHRARSRPHPARRQHGRADRRAACHHLGAPAGDRGPELVRRAGPAPACLHSGARNKPTSTACNRRPRPRSASPRQAAELKWKRSGRADWHVGSIEAFRGGRAARLRLSVAAGRGERAQGDAGPAPRSEILWLA